MPALHSAELAWYVTGRFYSVTDGTLADYGYFLHLAGIEAGLFNGPPGEATAHFTFAAVPFRAGGISNGALSLALDPAGDFSLYLQRTQAPSMTRHRSPAANASRRSAAPAWSWEPRSMRRRPRRPRRTR